MELLHAVALLPMFRSLLSEIECYPQALLVLACLFSAVLRWIVISLWFLVEVPLSPRLFESVPAATAALRTARFVFRSTYCAILEYPCKAVRNWRMLRIYTV